MFSSLALTVLIAFNLMVAAYLILINVQWVIVSHLMCTLISTLIQQAQFAMYKYMWVTDGDIQLMQTCATSLLHRETLFLASWLLPQLLYSCMLHDEKSSRVIQRSTYLNHSTGVVHLHVIIISYLQWTMKCVLKSSVVFEHVHTSTSSLFCSAMFFIVSVSLSMPPCYNTMASKIK